MSNYAQLQDRINLDYLNRSDLIAETKRAIQTAIRYYERKRWWFNETSTAVLASAGQSYVTLPTDFLVPDYLSLTVSSADYELTEQDFTWVKRSNSNYTRGQPTYYALYQNRVELSPIPSSAYSITIHYIQRLSVLSADTDSNAWTSAGAEDVIAYHATKLMLATHLAVPDKAATFAALERQAYTEFQSAHEQRRVHTLKSTQF